MPRKATGSFYEKRGDLYASITVARGASGRMSAKLAARNDADADKRVKTIAAAVVRLRAASIERDLIETLVTDMAMASPARLAGLLSVVDDACAAHEATDADVLTFGQIAAKWTSGELHKAHPAHVKKIDQDVNRLRFDKHVLPIVGDVPITLFALDHAERVMRQESLPELSRRHVAQLITRVCNLAVYPLRSIKVSPIPRGWLPKPNPKKAGSFLYPDEDAALLACRDVPVEDRIFYGFLDREGMRKSEGANVEWTDLDLTRGVVNLDENKTDDPRSWKMDPGVTAALRWWKIQREGKGTFVFGNDDGAKRDVGHLAEELRSALQRAGIERPALFESSGSRMRLRAHDLRATFVTVHLANGKTEAWVTDRTGHQSSAMVANYRRQARMASELDLGPLKPLVDALPESSAIVEKLETPEGGSHETTVEQGCDGRDLNSDALGALEPKADRDDRLAFEEAFRSASTDAFGDETATLATRGDDSATIRRLRRTRLGRACVEAVDAALSGDDSAIRRTMFRLGEVHGGLRRSERKRRRVGRGVAA